MDLVPVTTSTILVLLATLMGLGLLLLPRLRTWSGWRATVTPLASIIGSGFLVLGPIPVSYTHLTLPTILRV